MDYQADLTLTAADGSKKHLTGTLSDGAAPPAYDLRSNFNAAPLGPLTTANKSLVWSDPAILSISEADKDGKLWSIVEGGRNGGQCARAFYEQGKVGEQGYYRLNLPPGKGAVSLEFDWMFETPFDLTTGSGKIGPFLVWGPRSGSQQGINTPICWESKITDQPKRWTWALQSRQGTGPSGNGQFIQGWYSPDTITIGRWYHWRFELFGGPGAYAKLWLDGTELSPPVADMSGVTNADDAIAIEFGFWQGGTNSAAYDCWARHDNVHIWA